MKILVTGASGLVGSALIPYLKKKGHEVRPVIRTMRPAEGDEVRWDPEKGFIDYKDLEGVDVFINLSGESISEGRWTADKKGRILASRVGSTNFLAQLIASLDRKPRLLINASAIGYYGSQGAAILTEKSPKGTGFLSDVCAEWENAVDYARRKGIRVACLRFGMILSPKGGALAAMLGPFKWGFGGKVGSGKQWWSWIALEDVLGAINHVIDQADLEGAVNVVSPFPVTNKEFTQVLARRLNRPAFFPLPAFMARLMLGEMADELLLASQRVEPDRLIKTGYVFALPKLSDCLKTFKL